MKTPFPEKTPVVVRRALQRYAMTRKLVGGLAGVLAALAAAGLIVLGCLLLDRFVECSPVWRVWGARAALTVLAAGVLAGVAAMVRPVPWFALAVRLDQARSGNRDRWATALDMAARAAAGADTGSPERLARLFAETESLTSAAGVARLVNRRLLWLAGGVLVAVLAVFGGLQGSGVCNLPLLAKRFWYPHGNWPRDSFATIRIVSVNGQAPPAMGRWAALPEESAFVLAADIGWRAPAWRLPWRHAADGMPVVLPRLEVVLPGGDIDSQEFIPAGPNWTVARQNLASDMTFRIRAGDGLTEAFRQPVTPRLKITAFEHAIRFPGYSKMAPVKRQALAAERLSVLEGSSLDFFVACNGPIRDVRAVFDVFPKKQTVAAVVGNPLLGEDGEVRRIESMAPAKQPPQRRILKVTRIGEERARFTVMADESGILRVEAVGTNGLPCREKAVIVEAGADTPPRLTVSGLEPITWIAPGELMGLDYTAEDDLGVTDLLLEWTVAGGANFEHLTGEEYIDSPQLGQKLVTGNQIIQRMNYFVYAQAPFEFQLVATDSKGQETRSAKFQIQLVHDDFATRCTDGLAIFKALADQAHARLNLLQAIQNPLNIVALTVKGADRWSAAQDPILDNLLDVIQPYSPYSAGLLRARLEFGDLPTRLEHSLAVLFAAEAMIEPEDALRKTALELRTAPQPVKAVENMQADLAARREFLVLLRAAALAERERFKVEEAYQTSTKLGNRLELLTAVPGDRSVYEANLTNYAAQASALPREFAGLVTKHPKLTPVFERLGSLPTPVAAADLQRTLRDMADALCDLPAPPTEEQAKLVARIAALASGDAAAQERFRTALAGYLRIQTAAVIPAPVANLRLGRAWLQDGLKSDLPWFNPPVSAADVWLAADQLRKMLTAYRMDILCGRFSLNPARRQDTEAELREYAIGVQEMAAACPEVDVATRAALDTLLKPVIRRQIAPVGESVATVPPAVPVLPAALVAAGRTALGAVENGLESDFDLLAARFEKAAVRYDALSTALTPIMPVLLASKGEPGPELASRLAPCRTEAQQLMAQSEAMEDVCRNIIYVKLCGLATGLAPPAWEVWQPLHGLLLAFTTVGLTAREQITFRPQDDKARKPIGNASVAGARAAAAGYRTYAGQLRPAARGQRVTTDFNTIMKESRTLGFLDSLQKEYDLLLPALKNTGPAGLESLRTNVTASGLAQIAMAERTLETALAARVPGAKDAQQRVDKETAALRAKAQIPVARRPPRQNQRDRQMDAQGTWQIADTIQNHDVRWAARVQDAELALSRDLVALCVPGFLQPDAATHLALDYARLVELRGRQLVAERRRNQGFLLSEGDSGPRLRLPKHIANEFFRARNRRSPEQFRDWSESYYSELYDAAGK